MRSVFSLSWRFFFSKGYFPKKKNKKLWKNIFFFFKYKDKIKDKQHVATKHSPIFPSLSLPPTPFLFKLHFPLAFSSNPNTQEYKTMISISLTILTLCVAVFVYWFVNFIRTRNSTPLPPGPRPWPIIGNLPHLGPYPHHSIADLARKYGPLMHLRLGLVDVVVAASASVAAQFLKTHDANFSSRPPNSGAKHIAYNYQDLVFAPYGPRWRMLRKICSVHLFSGKALDDFRHVRQVSNLKTAKF